MKNRYEILAPAGSFEALQAAVQNGANAVYLSGKDFGARKFANNFSNEELVEAIKYCHIRGVGVYVTVNTLIFNHEFDKLRKYIDFLYTSGVDAVIVQDIGVLNYIRKTYTDFEIHCSTQMSVQTVEDIKYLESLGANRVVLGREMTVEDIRRAKQETEVELEVFVHGSLCISVSGQCLMSSMIGRRSGNRGSCAQPCRQKYSLYNDYKNEKYNSQQGDYLLSPKDLYTLEEVSDIIGAGAYSLKIEGRMKSPEYVATVVGAYRVMIESAYLKKHVNIDALEKDLKIFNRGFTKGHLFNQSGHNLMSMESPANQGYYLGTVLKYDNKAKRVSITLDTDLNHNDEIQIRRKDESIGGRVEKLELKGKVVKDCKKGQTCEVNFKHSCKPGEKVYKTFDTQFMKLKRQSFINETLEIPVEIDATILEGTPITCSISDGQNNIELTTDIITQAAIKRALTAEDVKSQLSKLGGTPYKVSKININIGEGLALSIKDLNGIRRMLVEKLNQKKIEKYNRQSKLTEESKPNIPKRAVSEGKKKIELTYSVGNIRQLKRLIELGAQIIYYKDLETLEEAVYLTKELNFRGKLIPEIFKLIPDEELEKYKKQISSLKLDTVLIQSYGHINKFNDFSLIGDYNLNMVNDLSYDFYTKNNFLKITLSPELNLSQIIAMDLEPEKTEILGYGYLPVMAMKHCVISTTLNKGKNCGLCYNNSYSVIDRMGEGFKIKRRYKCNTEIHNSRKIMLLEHYEKLEKAGVGFYRLNFLDETPEELEIIVDIHHKYMYYQLNPRDEKNLEAIKNSGVTYGHLNRGIE